MPSTITVETAGGLLPLMHEAAMVMRRRKWLIMTCFLVPAVGAVALSFVLTPQYQPASMVLIQSGREYTPQTDGENHNIVAPVPTMQETVQTEIEILKSSDVARAVLKAGPSGGLHQNTPSRFAELRSWACTVALNRFGPSSSGFLANACHQPSKAEQEAAAERAFSQNLIVAPVKLSNVISVAFRGPDPVAATDTLRRVLHTFEEQHVRAFSRHRSTVMSERLAQIRDQIGKLEAEREQYSASHRLFSATEQRAALVSTAAQHSRDLQAAEIQRVVLQARVRYLRAEMQKTPNFVTMEESRAESPVAQDTQRHLRELQTKQQEMMANYRSSSSVFASLRAGINSSKAALADNPRVSNTVRTGRNPLVPEMQQQILLAEAELTPLNDKVKSLRDAIGDTDRQLATLGADELHQNDLSRQISELNLAANTLAQRLADSQYQDELDQARIASLSIIQQPTVPQRPVFPNKRIFLAAGVAAGAFLSGIATLLLMTFGRTFLTAQTVARVLDLPVILVLPPPRPQLPARMRALPQPSDFE